MLETQDHLINPLAHIEDDYKAVYERGEVFVGIPNGTDLLFQQFARTNTVAIIGMQFGDEGKGRVVDNKIEHLLKMGAKSINVVRYQGGANAGHTIGLPNGESIALHQLPSGILYEENVGIMDRGMIIHMEDLQTEINDAEESEYIGDLRGKLILNPDAALCTDLDRAQEVLNRDLSSGKSSGGTGRGIAPTEADRISRRGLTVGDLFKDDWEEKFSRAYELREEEFNSHGKWLADTLVPDLKETQKNIKEKNGKDPATRAIGSRNEYLGRLAEVRKWYLDRDEEMPSDKKLLQNTFNLYQNNFNDLKHGFLFEGAQAVGLDPNFGRIPDVTSTDTTIFGIAKGTQFPSWNREVIEQKIGVMKLTYMSSVGAFRMPTDSGIDRRAFTPEEISSTDDEGKRFAMNARMTGHEFGATTGRPRDICFLDLPIMRYNSMAGGVEMLAGTHLDIAEEGKMIKVCTHYEDMAGNYIPYQPGIEHQKQYTPVYQEVDGWDGEATRRATCFDELPDNAKKFLAYVQKSIGRTIVFITTGPARENAMEIPKYNEV
jgi:adenylosuccinate synthase